MSTNNFGEYTVDLMLGYACTYSTYIQTYLQICQGRLHKTLFGFLWNSEQIGINMYIRSYRCVYSKYVYTRANLHTNKCGRADILYVQIHMYLQAYIHTYILTCKY